MASATNKVSSVLRIVRGERDALVRTAHFKAASENVSFATIERKTMSTKTSFKRVALVAVAALGLGVLSSVSASAKAPVITATQVASGTTATQVIGGQAKVSVAIDSATVTSIVVSGVGTVVSHVFSAESSTTTYIANSVSWTDSVAGGGASGVRPTDVITLYSTVAGSQVVTVTPLGSDGAPGTAVTKTITWAATNPSGTLDHSNAFISAGDDADAQFFADDTTAIAPIDATASATRVATISVMQFAALDTTTESTLTAAKAVTVSISGAGAVAAWQSDSTRGGVATAAAAGANGTRWSVYPDGRTGPAVITIAVNGVTVATKTLTFFGATTQLIMDDTLYTTPTKTYLGVGETMTIILQGGDAAGNASTSLTTLVATSATTTVATTAVAQGQLVTSGSTTNEVITVTGVALGTSVITASIGALATATITKTFTITVTEKSAAAAGSLVTMTFDKATYAPGEKMTLTVAATGATGTKIADGTRTLFSTAPSANVANIGTLPTADVALVGGKKTFTLFAPLVSGDVSLTAVDNTAALKAVTATATVSGGSADAALDAANEATDAAYAAADAADNATQAAVDAGAAAALAQESADAALAAVTDLGIKVTAQIEALSKMLEALSKSLANIYKISKAIQAKQK